jgi:hypothetical protein
MRVSWRSAWVVGLSIATGGAPARAQVVGVAATTQAGGAPAQAEVGGADDIEQPGRPPNAARSRPAEVGGRAGAPNAQRLTPPQRFSPYYNRVTTTRREVVSLPPPAARVARPGGTATIAGRMDPADALHPYRHPPSPARARAPIPAGSSLQDGPPRPASPSPTMVQSSSHTYYPGMRTARFPNANTAPTSRAGRGRVGIPMGLGVLAMPGAARATAARPGASATPGRVPTSAGPARPR